MLILPPSVLFLLHFPTRVPVICSILQQMGEPSDSQRREKDRRGAESLSVGWVEDRDSDVGWGRGVLTQRVAVMT